jgi:hypothetical protein
VKKKKITQECNYDLRFANIRSISASSSFVCLRLAVAVAVVGTRGALAIYIKIIDLDFKIILNNVYQTFSLSEIPISSRTWLTMASSSSSSPSSPNAASSVSPTK